MSEYKAINFEVIECCECHCLFCVTKEHKKILIETKETFYCPNGHAQSYTGTSNDKIIQNLRKKIISCSTEKSEILKELHKTEKSVKAYKMLLAREKKKLKEK